MELKISWTEFLYQYRIKEIKEKARKKTEDEIYYLFYKTLYKDKTKEQIKKDRAIKNEQKRKEALDRAIKKEQKKLKSLERRKADARVRSLARYYANKDEINRKRRERNKKRL